MSPIIELVGINKVYELGTTRVAALRDVDLQVGSGELTVVTGPSGSGKTTLLNIIGGLDRACAGSYRLEGEEVSNRDFDELADLRQRKIGFIFQSFSLIPMLNVAENIEFPCVMRLSSEPRERLRQRVEALSEAVGLKPFLQHKPDQLTEGQRQRVAIARALVTQPRLVLADEPTAHLDSKTRQQLFELMLWLNRDQGVTFLLATHDAQVVRHARRVLYLEEGHLAPGQAGRHSVHAA